MSIFGNILGKIFHHDAAKVAPTAPSKPAPTSATPSPIAPDPAPAPASGTPASAAVQQPSVDVGAVLDTMASMKPDQGGNHNSSIVDLLKLLDLDSSLTARKELAGTRRACR